MKTIAIIAAAREVRAALKEGVAACCPRLSLSGEAGSGEEGLGLIRRTAPDLVLLEAELPGEAPFQALSFFESQGALPFGLIALSEHEALAFQAYRHGAIDYLLLPVGRAELSQALARAQGFCMPSLSDWRYRTYPVADQKEISFVLLKDLIYAEAKGNTTLIHALGQPEALCLTKGLGKVAASLSKVPFLYQISRSHLANLLFAKRFVRKTGHLLLASPQHNMEIVLPVARERWRGLVGVF